MMGYVSRVFDEIRIDPPLTWAEARATGFVQSLVEPGVYYRRCVRLQIEEAEHDTDDGRMLSRRAVAIVGTWEDDAKYYSIDTDLEELLKDPVFKRRILSGWLVREGEEQGDVERYGADRDGALVVQKASMQWPDGTAVQP